MCSFNYSESKQKGCQLYYSDGRINTNLPLDKKSLCFFHSTNVTFKIQYDVINVLKESIKWLDENSNSSSYDFTEARIGAGLSLVKLENLELKKEINFHKAIFFARLEIENLNYEKRLLFTNAEFRNGIALKNCNLKQVDFSYSLFNSLLAIENSIFKDGKLLLVRSNNNFTFIIRNSKIQATISCFESAFGGVVFKNNLFSSSVSFEGGVISKQLIVDNCIFEDNVDFINTELEITGQGLNDNYSPIHFKDIKVGNESIFNFKGKHPQGLLTAETSLSFLFDELLGKIHFTNVNLNYLDALSKERIFSFLHSGKVIIGYGCLRYRHQEIKTIILNQSNQSLVIELSQIFTNFFEKFNGINLGVEIQSKTEEKISLIYFSDENISREEFINRLAITERQMWQLVGSELKDDSASDKISDKLVHSMDTLINLTSLFFKICIRIPFGKISYSDLDNLISSTNFNGHKVIKTEHLNKIIINHYNQSVLFGINNNQIISIDTNKQDTNKR